MTTEENSHLAELLEVLEGGVLALDRPGAGDPVTAIHKLFQSAHNLKSGLAMAGLERAAKYFHHLEDGLDAIRRGRAQWSGQWVDRVLEAVDLVGACLDDGHDESMIGVEVEAVEEVAPSRTWGMKLTDAEKSVCDAAASRGDGLYRIEKFFSPGLTREDFETLMVLEDIRAAGELITVAPDYDTYAQSEGEIVVRFMFASEKSATELEQVFFDPLITVKAPGPERRRDPRSKPIRFLVVDDDRIQADMLSRILEAWGEPVLRPNGAEAVREFIDAFEAEWSYPVVVLDIEMPVMSGTEALKKIRDYEASQGIHGLDRCLIYMNTSITDLAKVKISFREQADGYFIKPYSLQDIRAKVEEALPTIQAKNKG